MIFKGVMCKDYIWARFITWINVKWRITVQVPVLQRTFLGAMMYYKLIMNQEIPAVVKNRLVSYWVLLAEIYPSSGTKQFCSNQYWLIHCKKEMDDPESPFGTWGGWLERWSKSKDQMSSVQRKGWRKNPTTNLKYVRKYMEKGNNTCAKVECKFRLDMMTTFWG